MRFDYFDMLSGESLPVSGVGHIRSPKLCELHPASGIGYKAYNVYLNFLSWDKEAIIKYDKIMQYRGASKLNRNELSTFDVITLLKQTRDFCGGILSFFIDENLVWNEEKRSYFVVAGEDSQIVGIINRDNFEDVRQMMLLLNFVGVNNDEAPIAHTSDKAKELWEKSQKFLQEQAKKEANEDKPEYHLGNIISKICAAHPSYNLLNIYNLTVFQLYDAFFQIGYLRSMDLNERIFSAHGGDKFKFENWLTPVLKNT